MSIFRQGVAFSLRHKNAAVLNATAGIMLTIAELFIGSVTIAGGGSGRFCPGLSSIAFIHSLIAIATSFGPASIILLLVLVSLTVLAAMTTGSASSEVLPQIMFTFATKTVTIEPTGSLSSNVIVPPQRPM